MLFDSYAFESTADFVKAIGHEKRLQLIDLLSVQEQCVEDLASAMGIGIKSVSAHLRVMRTQGILTTRKQGLRVYYRLRNNAILGLYLHIREVALDGKDITPLNPERGLNLSLKELLVNLESENVLLIDVRDRDAYLEGHIPNAISVPVDELVTAIGDFIEQNKQIIVYCEGYYCIQAIDALNILLAQNCRVKVYRSGLNGWKNAGFALES